MADDNVARGRESIEGKGGREGRKEGWKKQRGKETKEERGRRMKQ
ncbi:MAG: hypothetical protein Q4D10_07220 [Bacteroidales bacterium]|nr:hypothetical protein [Bacteroidales bacterium]